MNSDKTTAIAKGTPDYRQLMLKIFQTYRRLLFYPVLLTTVTINMPGQTSGVILEKMRISAGSCFA